MKTKISKLDSKINEYAFLSSNSIKIIAIITMFIDHLSKIVLQSWAVFGLSPKMEMNMLSQEQYITINAFVKITLTNIGQIAFPLFCFLLVEGFHHTKNRKKYLSLMILFALISEIPFDIAFFYIMSIRERTFPFNFNYQNVFFTLALGILLMTTLERIEKKFPLAEKPKISVVFQCISVGFIAIIADLIKADYGSMGILFVFFLFTLKKSRLLQVISVLIVYMIYTGNIPSGFFLISSFAILCYNGKRGNLNLKYFFYLFYPLHIILLFASHLFLAYSLGYIDVVMP